MGKIDHLLAFYLPQFHPIAENDSWWGEGFTEWRNVVTSQARYKGHHQPHIPSDLGFYDLRCSETREAQAKLAAAYGISGFCYYHYWFNGKRLLNRPLDDVLETKQPNYPFCICWANENWTRAWDGQEKQILIKQNYSIEDLENHVIYLAKVFTDNRYIRVNGKPLFVIYRHENIPKVEEYIKLLRTLVRDKINMDLHLCAVYTGFTGSNKIDVLSAGFDDLLDFQPNRSDFPESSSPFQRVVAKSRTILPKWLYEKIKRNASVCKIVSYKDLVSLKIASEHSNDNMYKCVFPSWDNSARRKTPTVIENHDGKAFGKWLKYALNETSNREPGNRTLFINAWNEWAEGCHLEPDLRNGKMFLETVKQELLPYIDEK